MDYLLALRSTFSGFSAASEIVNYQNYVGSRAKNKTNMSMLIRFSFLELRKPECEKKQLSCLKDPLD